MMAEMTRKERLWSVYKKETPDRVPVKLWGLDNRSSLINPAYKIVYDNAAVKTDLIRNASSRCDIVNGKNNYHLYEVYDEPYNKDWTACVKIMHTPEGDLRSVQMHSTKGHPGLDTEHFVKDEDDLKKILALEYEPFTVDLKEYRDALGDMGDDGLVMFSLPHPAYTLQILTGSENLGYLLYDAPELVYEAITVFSKRLNNYIKAVLEAGIASGSNKTFAVGYVGPELFIPPLVSFDMFEKYVYDIDKPNIDLIKNAGGYVWVHSHGKVRRLIPRFADMGIDVLNPIEPPPMGDCSISEALKAADGKITLEGNIEVNDLMNQNEEFIRAFVESTVKTAAEQADKKFILCQSAGAMEYVQPSENYINNLLTYINYGIEMSKKYAN